MPADRQDLGARIAAATEADTSRGLNYASVFRLLRDHLGEAAALECDPLGKGSRIELLKYPIAEYLTLAWNAVDRLEGPAGGVEAAFEALGRRTIQDYLDSMLGRTLFAIAGRDPRRMVSNIPSGYRAAVSYGERTVEWLGDRSARVVFRRDFMPPAFHAGVMRAGLAGMGARDPRVTARQTRFLDAEFEIGWEI
ncbi:MAG TPA: DUF2378 family protein [Anaeromyxobacteraceae bacterium]|nr:DUF2378 family protein [Anaeromyxobacteraceae bacterium]